MVLGDRGYDHDKDRRLVWDLAVKPRLHWFRRLRIRWEIRDDVHEAFLTLGCALICRRRLCALASDALG